MEAGRSRGDLTTRASLELGGTVAGPGLIGRSKVELHHNGVTHWSSAVALNIKNPEVERLAAEVAGLTGESKTEAIRRALAERQRRLRLHVRDDVRRARIDGFLEREIWARVPPDQLGRAPTKAEREEILGYGPEGA